MDELLVIVSENNDIVYKYVYNKTSDEEYCKLIVFAYGSVDTLIERARFTSDNYFDCLDKYRHRKVSAYIMPSGYKILFIHDKQNAKQFLEDIHHLFATILVLYPLRNEIIEDLILDKEMESIYGKCF